MEFLNEYHLAGLFIGICTFLIIGLFHPVVVKAEYYWGTKCWWIFLVLGIAGVIASLSIDNVILSSLLGVFAFSSFRTIKEVFEQEAQDGPRKIPVSISLTGVFLLYGQNNEIYKIRNSIPYWNKNINTK